MFEGQAEAQMQVIDQILKEEPKRFICPEEDCGKVFPDQASLRKHQVTHGERAYICKVDGCGKKFLDNSKLKRH